MFFYVILLLLLFSVLSLGVVDKRNVWLEDASFDNIATQFILGKFVTTLTSHPTPDILRANIILPVYSLFEQGIQLFNIAGESLSTFSLDFTTGRVFMRTESALFVTLSYFFELFFYGQKFLRKYDNNVTFFPNNTRLPFLQTSLKVFSSLYLWKLTFGSRKNLSRNFYVVDSLTASSKFLVLAAKRFKQQNSYA